MGTKPPWILRELMRISLFIFVWQIHYNTVFDVCKEKNKKISRLAFYMPKWEIFLLLINITYI